MSITEAGKPTLLSRLAPEASGFALYPLAVLFLLNFVDEFDRWVFGLLTPEIKVAFGFSNAAIGGIVALSTGVVYVATPFVGFLADRLNRVRMLVVAAIVWGFFAFSSGIAAVALIFVLVRFGSGLAKLVNEPVHPSLLADYYPPAARGRVFSVNRSANAMAAIIAPGVVGVLGHFFGWRPAFMLTAIPTIAVVFLAVRLREPMRGATDDPDAAAEAAKEPPVSFGRAVRWLYSVPTLKRIYVGAFFGGLGGVAFGAYASTFRADIFGVSILGRTVLDVIGGAIALVGFLHGGRIADRWMRTKTPASVALFYGGAVTALGISLIGYAVSPTLPINIGVGFVVAYFLALWVPPYLTVIGFSSPARIRSLGFSYAAFFFGLGTFFIPIFGSLGDSFGLRWTLVAAAIVLTMAGGILASSSKFANRDVNRALKVLSMEAQLRAERLAAGERSLLMVRDLDVAYDGVQVLFGVDFEVKEGELVALLGTNGAGKSTLLKAISGLVHPSAGAVFFDGKDITHLEPEETAEAGIIQMPGGKSVFPSLTVRENIEMATWLSARDRAYVEQGMKRVLGIFPVLSERFGLPAGSLSGGEQQMLSLAQAFIARPKILMIDELSLGLAPLLVQQLMEIVKQINDQGTTIVLVEQSVNVALTVARHAYFMEKGEIVFDGKTDELLGRTDILRSVFLEGAVKAASDGSVRKARTR